MREEHDEEEEAKLGGEGEAQDEQKRGRGRGEGGHAISSHHLCHLSLNRQGRWGTTYDFATSFTPGLSIP